MPGTGFQKVLQRDQDTYERQAKGYIKAATGYNKEVDAYNTLRDAYVKKADAYNAAVGVYNEELKAAELLLPSRGNYPLIMRGFAAWRDPASGGLFLRKPIAMGEVVKVPSSIPNWALRNRVAEEGLVFDESTKQYRKAIFNPAPTAPAEFTATPPAEFTTKEPKAPSGITQKQLRAQGGAFGDTPALRSAQRDDANRNAQPVLSDADLARAMNAGIPPATLDAATARNLADIENKAMIQGFDAARLNRS